MLPKNTIERDSDGPPGDCVDFSRYPHLQTFANEFRLGWFQFSNLGTRALDIWSRNPPDESGSGIRFDKHGLRVTLNRISGSITVVGNSGAGPLQLVAYTGAAVVDRATIVQARTPTSVTLNGRAIHSLVISDSAEPVVTSICCTAIDPGMVFDDALSSGANQSDAIRRNLEHPRGASIRDQQRREFKDYYEGRRMPRTGGGLGGRIGVDLYWPPDWACVMEKIAIYLAVTIFLIVFCESVGITLLQLSTEKAVELIVAEFGVSAATAGVIFWSIRLSGATMGAFWKCGVFGDIP